MKKVTPRAVFIWSLAILFFFYEFFLRIVPGTLSKTIIHDLNISIEQFALIGSAYYVIYGLMQMPVGIIVDKFGVRLFLTLACFICALGTVGFSFAYDFPLAFISRLAIGLGSAFAFVSLLVLAVNWFPEKHFGLCSGLAQFLGAVGPLLAGAPIAYIVDKTGGWRSLFIYFAVFGLALGSMIALFVRNKPARSKNKVIFIDRKTPFIKLLKELVKISQVWWILIYSGCTYVALPLFGAFWGTAYLQSRGLTKTLSALVVSTMWIGFSIGAPCWGKLSDATRRRKPFLILPALVGLIASTLILFLPTSNTYLLILFFILIGFASSGQSLSFPVISENVKEPLKATSLGLNNSSIMLLASILPPIATMLINISAKGETITQADYTSGFILIPITYAISTLTSLLFIKETYCRSQHKVYSIHHNGKSQ